MKNVSLLLFLAGAFVTAQKPCGLKDGLQEGTCKQFYESGQVKEIADWKKGKLEGEAVFYYENGKVQAQGEYKKDYKVKEWAYYDKDGKLTAKEIFRNGEKNVYDNSSTVTFYSPSGIITEISTYKYGKLNGESKVFSEDGKSLKQLGYYENGIATGKWKVFYPSGKIQRETEFLNNERDGNRIHYREDGSVEKTEIYKNGKLISTK